MSRGAAIFLAVSACLVSSAQAMTLRVNTAADGTDHLPGDGVCETSAGNRVCSLRAAVQEANALAGPDSVILGSGIYVLSIPGSLENDALTGDLDLKDDLSVIGKGRQGTILDGGGLDRLFDVHPAGAGPVITVSDLTIRNGTLLFDENFPGLVGGGGGILVRGGQVHLTRAALLDNQINDLIQAGGAILNRGDLTLRDCIVMGNRAFFAGGIVNHPTGFLDVASTLLSSNTAFGSIGSGGALFNLGIANISNSTISNNTVSERNCGGINNRNLLALGNVTIAANVAAGQGGGLCNQGAISVENSIIASNAAMSAPNCLLSGGSVSSFGYNFEDLNTCDLTDPTDHVNTNTGIGPLEQHWNSGTHAPLPSSPVIDAGNPGGCFDVTDFPSTLTADQRGALRPLDGDGLPGARCDSGAHEFDRHNIWSVVATGGSFKLTWQPLPGDSGYLVYRGDVSALTSGEYGACQTTTGDLAMTEFPDAADPAVGEAFFYLVTARVGGIEQTLGFDSLGRQRIPQPGDLCP